MARPVSPTSTGPAGPQFEAQVGASYLLALLVGAEPRGLPGMVIDRVEFQRASEGRPLDDIIVHAHAASGTPAILEIQVKRGVTFSPSDKVFADIVREIAAAANKPEFWSSRYELAIATAKISKKLSGSYQDVLTWARQIGCATTFMNRINRRGSSNPDMRSFVETFRNRLQEAGVPHDDERVWHLLRRLQIFFFDFTAPGSADELLSRDRASQTLHPDDSSHASTLWNILVELALGIAASGGDRDRNHLIKDLSEKPFRLLGERRHTSARARLAEESQSALDDIGATINGVMLIRDERLSQIRSQLDLGRYVEIRGDSGVGKSALLKHLAQQLSLESRIVVLSPNRTKPRGWSAMRADLGFDGTAREFLADLAGNGATTLFIDNLDHFSSEERLTVVDLVRAATDIPGVAIVATVRTSFGTDEPNWLPENFLDRLGRVAPVVIDELNNSEVEELCHAAPQLSSLLADSHPARPVARNLFRLARLAIRGNDEGSPRTEAEMAKQWWQSADGSPDSSRRERTRILRSLVERIIVDGEPLDGRDSPPTAIDALISSGTLRDLGGDKVAFRHDVLAEWGVGCLLSSHSEVIETLPLNRPSSALLARGMELSARIILEEDEDSIRWQKLLERLSLKEVHGSWRRAVLLALVRTEGAADVLTKVSPVLLTDRARLLREIIRTVRAVDVIPAADVLATAVKDPSLIPSHINMPRGPSWPRLILWLFQHSESIPAAAIPDIVDLYTDWSLWGFGTDPLTPLLMQWIYRWLINAETAGDIDQPRNMPTLFVGGLDGVNLSDLESNLRTAFVLFCDRTPSLAISYLQAVMGRRRNEETVSSILKFSGKLGQAAPVQLAELTASALTPHNEEERDVVIGRSPFTWIDTEFSPASPSQGPFFDLLTHAPQQGLSLIRRLVDHAITFHTRGRPYGSNVFEIELPEGKRLFPWKQSYGWSRGWGQSFTVSCALMALEAWAHKRIEAGESFNAVLRDVLGTGDTPAAYLLIVVDLLISHWPASRQGAVPFLTCPELLCFDRQRWGRDTVPVPDFFGVDRLNRERNPHVLATLDGLKARPSRRISLDNLLVEYSVDTPQDLHEKLVILLRNAQQRLGPYAENADLGDPAFMAIHAGNLINAGNYTNVQIPLRDGRTVSGLQYVPPETERLHMERLTHTRSNNANTINMQLAISAALDNQTQSSADFAQRAVEWAQTATSLQATEEEGDSGLHEQAVVGAAMIIMRDGTFQSRESYRDWAQITFRTALRKDNDAVHRVRGGIKFNPMAMAFAGMAYGLDGGFTVDGVRELLMNVDRPAAAHGFIAVAPTLEALDDRLPRSILRCAMAGCIQPVQRWDESEGQRTEQERIHRQMIESATAAEISWLFEGAEEPTWQAPPLKKPRTRRRSSPSTGGSRARPTEGEVAIEKFDYQVAALWLQGASRLPDIPSKAWIKTIVSLYADWTWVANGRGLKLTEDVRSKPHEWNRIYLTLLARTLIGANETTIDRVALEPLASLPDESFFDTITNFQRVVDEVFFNDQSLEVSIAVHIRSRLAEKLKARNGWIWFIRRRSSVELHLGPSIATLFFNQGGSYEPATAYLLPPAIDRLIPFLPILEPLAIEGASPFVAKLTLNLLEVSPQSAHFAFLLKIAGAWLSVFPTATDFWINHDIGRRVCILIDTARRKWPELLTSNQSLRDQVDRILPALTRLGVAEAARLEQNLAESTSA